MNEFLAFRKFITPLFIQVIFWIGVAVIVIASIVVMSQGGVMILAGLLALPIWLLFFRIYCELLILLFRIYDELVMIRTGSSSAPGGFPVTPMPQYQQPMPAQPYMPPPAPPSRGV